MPGDDRRDGRGDLRRVGPDRGDDAEQRFREAESLADPVDLACEHDARCDGDQERTREEQQRDGG